MYRHSSVAVIMYHRIGAEELDPHDTFLNVGAHAFAGQMGLLARLGYRAITFGEAVAGLSGRAALPKRTACLTFDDGFRSVLDHALPVLDRLQWPATVFVSSKSIGKFHGEGRNATTEADRVLDATGLTVLRDRGWEIGGHTRSHPLLAELADTDAFEEIAGGADDLRAILGVRPVSFCYPGGSYNARTPALVRQAGFDGACTTRSGLARKGGDALLIPRVKPAMRDGLCGFLYRLLIRPHLP